jgi:hypothetical protein
MQSLNQAVYRHVCYCSQDNRRGVTEEGLTKEMKARGYLEPVADRVRDALVGMLSGVCGAVTGPNIVRIGECYFQKRAYLKSHK